MIVFTEEKKTLLKNTICKGGSDDELELFIHICQKSKLDPFARQIYAVKRWDASVSREVMSAQASIDGFRLVAERSGKYAGQKGPFFYTKGADGEKWSDVYVGGPLLAAKVGVLRSDFQEPHWIVTGKPSIDA